MSSEDQDVRIVPATPGDAEALVNFLKQASHESDAVQITNLANLTAASEVDQLRAIDRSNRCEVVVARLGDQVIGVATIMISEDQPTTGELGVIVGKPYWHHGIGTALVESILDWYQHGSELSALFLDVFASNKRAIDLYHRFGFVESGISPTADDRELIRMDYMEHE